MKFLFLFQIDPNGGATMPMSHTSAVQSSREELIKLSQDIHSDVTKLMRNYTEGRDKLRVSLEQNVQKQQDSANFDLNNTYGQMNKVTIYFNQ